MASAAFGRQQEVENPRQGSIRAHKPEFLVEIALSLNPTEFWAFQAKNREFEPFPEQVPANLKIAIFGCPDLGPEPRPEDKNQANDAFGGFEFAGKFWAETG